MGVTLKVVSTAGLEQTLASLPSRITSGAKVTGARNTAFALIWEWGRVTCNPGPKTLWSTNPAGETRVLTKTAPFGYIRVNKQRYLDVLREEYGAIDMHAGLPGLSASLVNMFNNAAVHCAEIISQTAPVDTGELQDNIKPAMVNEFR